MSRIIKSPWIESDNTERKTIEIKPLKSLEPLIQEHELKVIETVNLDEIYQNANKEAEDILNAARQQAELIRKQIEQERNDWEQFGRKLLEEEAKEVGYNDGFSMGQEKGYEEVHSQIDSAKEVVELAKVDYRAYLESAERTILELALKVAKKIINKELEMSDEAYFQVVKKAIKEARDYKEVQLRVHPSNYEFLLSQKDELKNIFPQETNFYIFPDDELKATSCIIESSSGRIDASVDSQLQEIEQKLLELLEGE